MNEMRSTTILDDEGMDCLAALGRISVEDAGKLDLAQLVDVTPIGGR